MILWDSLLTLRGGGLGPWIWTSFLGVCGDDSCGSGFIFFVYFWWGKVIVWLSRLGGKEEREGEVLLVLEIGRWGERERERERDEERRGLVSNFLVG